MCACVSKLLKYVAVLWAQNNVPRIDPSCGQIFVKSIELTPRAVVEWHHAGPPAGAQYQAHDNPMYRVYGPMGAGGPGG